MLKMLLRWFAREQPVPPDGQSCKTCCHWADFSETDPEEPQGYCGHPFHSTWKSPHSEYGGHWASSFAWCEMWEQDDAQGEDAAAAAEGRGAEGEGRPEEAAEGRAAGAQAGTGR